MICIPITSSSVEKAIQDIKESEKSADLIELRIDYIRDICDKKLGQLLKKTTKKVIVACRPGFCQGNFKKSESERISLLKRAVDLKASYIDIEFKTDKQEILELIENKKNSKIIISYHDFKRTPEIDVLEKKVKDVKRLNPNLIKIVTYANSINDNFKIFDLLRKNNDLISFCMGLYGHMSRVLSKKYGSVLTYSSLSMDKESAPGQIPVPELTKVYNYNLINPDTDVLGVIGSHAENSLSKYLHNANFKKQNLNFIYVPFKVSENDLCEFMANFRRFGLSGAAVTIPHKINVMQFLDKTEKTAKEIAAVNTIVNKNNRLKGYNTDYIGAVTALENKTTLSNKKVLVIGAGGAARAICFGLKRKKAAIVIANRTIGKAEKLAEEIDCRSCFLEEMYKEDPDIIINTTSVGMYPDEDKTVVKKEFLKERVVFDIVYRPMVTRLLKEAKEMGSEIIKGYEMLLYQGIEQYRLWTGKDPDEELMRKKLKEQLGKK
ncbi:shikimate dehydrogenase [Candidatus Woesearchaeota archaeon]|nr:shikimate dehydrogenase [Candidatus Woesearchaeota archaeon]